jgi:hypothetical protein
MRPALWIPFEDKRPDKQPDKRPAKRRHFLYKILAFCEGGVSCCWPQNGCRYKPPEMNVSYNGDTPNPSHGWSYWYWNPLWQGDPHLKKPPYTLSKPTSARCHCKWCLVSVTIPNLPYVWLVNPFFFKSLPTILKGSKQRFAINNIGLPWFAWIGCLKSHGWYWWI